MPQFTWPRKLVSSVFLNNHGGIPRQDESALGPVILIFENDLKHFHLSIPTQDRIVQANTQGMMFKGIQEIVKPMSTIVHFDVPVEDIERAKRFYSALFDWKFESFPEMQYHMITTTDLTGAPGVGGGMGKRMDPSQHITNYYGVKSIDAAMKQVRSLGGSVVMGKMAVPAMGYLATCIDTEGNPFGLWEEDAGAK